MCIILVQKLLTYCSFAGARWRSFLFFVWVAISYQLQKPIHWIWMNIIHLSIHANTMIDWNLASRGGEPFVNFKLHSFNVKCSQKLVNLGNPFLSSILIQKLPKTQKMSNLVGFTHVFDMEISLFLCYVLWPCLCTSKFYPKHFYPKFSKFFPVHTRKVEKVHTLCSRSWLYMFNYLLI